MQKNVHIRGLYVHTYKQEKLNITNSKNEEVAKLMLDEVESDLQLKF